MREGDKGWSKIKDEGNGLGEKEVNENVGKGQTTWGWEEVECEG